MLRILGPTVISWIITFLTIPVCIRIARKFGITDVPNSGLKTHRHAVPYLGGLAMYCGILAGFGLALLMPEGTEVQKAVLILSGAGIIMLLGLIDDIRGISPVPKLLVEAAAGYALIKAGIYIQIKFFPYWLNIGITFFWVVAMTNAANLVDIMDGLCGGIVAIAAATFMVVGYLTGNLFALSFSGLILGSATAFLLYNRYPARIFAGDTGSLMLGYLLSAVSISISYTGMNMLGLFVPILILGIPLYDMALVIIFRLMKRQSPLKGSKDHFALRLQSLGFSVKETAHLVYLIALCLSILAVVIINIKIKAAILVYGITILFGFIFGKILAKLEVK